MAPSLYHAGRRACSVWPVAVSGCQATATTHMSNPFVTGPFHQEIVHGRRSADGVGSGGASLPGVLGVELAHQARGVRDEVLVALGLAPERRVEERREEAGEHREGRGVDACGPIAEEVAPVAEQRGERLERAHA